ncbi:MAG: ArsR/SmtB family transcription factor [Hyphomicrobiales bacterium]
MRDFERVLKAAGDPTRTRILKMLEGGALCGCQIQVVLGIAPSTISKHLAILRNADLVEDRREGKWIEYALTSEGRNPFAGQVLAMLRGPLDRDPAVVADRLQLREIRAIPRVELCVTRPGRRGAAPSTLRLRRPRKARSRV